MSKQIELLTVKPSETFYYEISSYGHYRYEKDWSSVLHTHPLTEIIYVLGGKGHFQTHDSRTELQKGSLVLTHPSCLHTEFSSEASPLEYVTFSVKNLAFSLKNKGVGKQSLTTDATESQEDGAFFFDLLEYHARAEEILRNIEYEINKKPPYWEKAFLTEFNRFLLLILRAANLSTSPAQTAEPPREKQNVAAHVKEYLNRHYADDLTLDELAQIFYVNKFYLAHAFKKTFGVSVMQYLNALRCEKAKFLLSTTDHSVSEISTSVGFSSAPYFSYVYKREFGESPQQTKAKRTR